MTTWYIAGPMTGREDWNYPAFVEAEQRLRAEFPADNVLNPAREFGGVTTFAREFYLSRAFENLRRADRVLLLDEWFLSAGACAEVIAAHEMGRDFWHQRGNDVEPCDETDAADYRSAVNALYWMLAGRPDTAKVVPFTRPGALAGSWAVSLGEDLEIPEEGE